MALLVLVTLGTAAADRSLPRYREFCEKTALDRFYDAPSAERDKLRASLKVIREGHEGEQVVLTIQAAAQPIRVAADSAGLIDFPVTPQLLAEDPPVLANLSVGEKVAFVADFRPIAPSRLQTDYASLMGSVPQANRLMKKQAGAFSLFAPSWRKVVLQYDPPRGQQVTIGDGESARRLTADAKGVITIPFDEATFARNPRVTLSELPRAVDFEN